MLLYFGQSAANFSNQLSLRVTDTHREVISGIRRTRERMERTVEETGASRRERERAILVET